MRLSLCIVLALLPVLAGCLKYTGATSSSDRSGLVTYWSFDDEASTVSDFSANGKSGTRIGPRGANDLPRYVEGRLGRGLSFDGTDDYVDAGTGLNSVAEGPMTVSVWIQPSSVSAGIQQLVSNAATATNQNLNLEINRTPGKLSVTWGNAVVLTGKTNLSRNQWYHVVMVRSGSRGNWTTTLYVDGVVDGTTSTTVNPNASGGKMLFGAYIFVHGKPGYFFGGTLDEVRIWDHALSSDEIAAL